jgi:pimeloyl-ACP methyl ester carboxylesterase
MNPFYFGTSERRLFGIYEPARSAGGRVRAAVICNPWGAEYVHAHRSLRHLAAKLSSAGYHTLRFDYFGTGDSGGESEEGDLAGWESDTATALAELRDIAGSSRVALIGLRLGANIAARVAACHAGDVDALLLWDPIRDGDRYLSSLLQGETRGGGVRVAADDLNGFPLPPRIQREIAAVDVGSLAESLPPRSLVITTDGSDATEAHRVGGLATECLSAPAAWAESATITGAVPARVIQRIVGWLA